MSRTTEDRRYIGGRVWQNKNNCSRMRIICLDADVFVLVDMESEGGGGSELMSFDQLKARLDAHWEYLGVQRHWFSQTLYEDTFDSDGPPP